ncbi:unnamed protein product, partial [Adineta ricciae]
MFLSFLTVCLFISVATSVQLVPGNIHVQLLPNNQVSSKTYRPGATVHYTVEFENVPMDDNVNIGIEIRGSNPAGGPRGYIALARSVGSIKNFVQETNNKLQFKLTPNEMVVSAS